MSRKIYKCNQCGDTFYKRDIRCLDKCDGPYCRWCVGQWYGECIICGKMCKDDKWCDGWNALCSQKCLQQFIKEQGDEE